MKEIVSIFIFVMISTNSFCQVNCNAFLYQGDTLKFDACKKAEETKDYYQFSREFQTILDDAIKIDEDYDYAYVEKSVAYLKSGDFLTWKLLMDEAVNINPSGNLGYRGWCRYQFFRDYEGAINDIERLDNLVPNDIGTSQNGDYHLQIVRAICYSALGQPEKGIEIIEKQLLDEYYAIGKYDYLHLGVMYLKIEDYEKALNSFKKQEGTNNIAENQYYLALTHKKLDNIPLYTSHLEESIRLYDQGRIMFDPYTHPYDKVYKSEIESELKEVLNGK